ncbi:hypothetical protein IV203_037182 [Nitzschia inconspicua]|uniref:Uncharacterized protein n=1 Tax=Nitzschia inconspicua TaxID=303405 RepID=A0A9K3LK94_9STRA|nr:hypothetical protein IV203_037182 [Nitzschia inconspicua]
MTDDNKSDDDNTNRKSSVAFAIDESEEVPYRKSRQTKRASERSSLRSSFFRLRSLSFRRSDGDRGADIDTLRGTHGPDFEGYAVINRGGGFGCGCFGGSGKNKQEQILLIKGPYLFVFAKESDPSPKYAIELAHLKTVMQQSSSGGVQHMTIETSLGDVEWELAFQKQDIAKKFAHAFKQQAAVGEAEEIRKKLGHEDLLQKRSSVKYAETVAAKKCEDQPEKKEIPERGVEELEREVEMMAPY